MRNQDFVYLGMSHFSALDNSVPARHGLVSCLIKFNNEVGRRLRTRCTISRSRQSASSSPVKNNDHRRSCSPWFGSVHSPPLCNSPTRYPSNLYIRSRNDVGDGLSDAFFEEHMQSKAYFSSNPPSEPVQIIIEPRKENLDYKFNSSTSHESRCMDEVASSSTSTLTGLCFSLSQLQSPTSHNSEVVRRILSSLLSQLPLVDAPSEASTYRFVSQYYDSKSVVRSETEQRSVAIQVAKSSTTVSVGNSGEHCDGKDNIKKKTQSKRRWMGSMRALRESHLRLMMRQIRQLRQIERLDRSLKRVCSSVRASCENELT